MHSSLLYVSELVTSVEKYLGNWTCDLQSCVANRNSQSNTRLATNRFENSVGPEKKVTDHPLNSPKPYIPFKYNIQTGSSQSLFDLAQPPIPLSGSMVSHSPAAMPQAQSVHSPRQPQGRHGEPELVYSPRKSQGRESQIIDSPRHSQGRDLQLAVLKASMQQRHLAAHEQARRDAPVQQARLQQMWRNSQEDRRQARRDQDDNVAISGIGRFARNS